MSFELQGTYSSIIGTDGPFEVSKKDDKFQFDFFAGLHPGFSVDETEIKHSTKKYLTTTQQAALENFKEYMKETHPKDFED